jgi:hypothetical protein
MPLDPESLPIRFSLDAASMPLDVARCRAEGASAESAVPLPLKTT